MSRSYDALAQSVKARLVQQARDKGIEPNLLLDRFALERFLYRLSKTPYVGSFVLKGAMLLLVWFGEMARPTRDADLLGFGHLNADELGTMFHEVCTLDVQPDGLRFDPSSVEIRQIRREDPYSGHRVTLIGYLGTARLKVQVDVGIGDAVALQPEWLDYPTLLQQPAPRIRAYRPETSIAEKLHAMVALGRRTSRLKDYFDVWLMARRMEFQASLLAKSIQATFERRDMQVPSGTPVALSAAFAGSLEKQAQWRAFLRKSAIEDAPTSLETVVADITAFLIPLLQSLGDDRDDLGRWPPGGPWTQDGGETHADN